MRRSAEERKALLEEWQASGETIRTFCERNELSFDSFKRWKRKAQEATTERTSFLPIVISRTSTPKHHNTSCRIMVGGVVAIECSEQTSQEALETAIRAAVRVCGPTSAA
jgi:hypothetical protein